MRRAPLPALTALRFFAATAVVIYHYNLTSPIFAHLQGLVWGYRAVTFFFILSGFILTYVYADAALVGRITAPAAAFWRSRFARVAPAYALAVLLALPFTAWNLHLGRITGFNVGLSFGATALFLQGWIPQATAIQLPGWSLSVEMLCYAMFPFIGPLRRMGPWRLALLSLLLASGYEVCRFATGFERPVDATTDIGRFAYFFPPFHVAEFLLGVAVGDLFLRKERLTSRSAALLLAVSAIAACAALGPASSPARLGPGLVLLPIFAVIIYTGASVGKGVAWLASRPLVLLGEASYAMFILHGPLLIFWKSFAYRAGLAGDWTFVPFFAGLQIVSIVTYIWIEEPLRRRIAGQRREKPAEPVHGSICVLDVGWARQARRRALTAPTPITSATKAKASARHETERTPRQCGRP